MGGQTTLTFWQLLLLSIGPATLTAIVALLGPYLLEGRKQEAEKKKRKAEKLEELIAAVYEFDHWVEKNVKNHLFDEKHEIGTVPLARIEGIVSIYFPQFKAQVEAITIEMRNFFKWSIKGGQKRLAGDKDHIDGYGEAYKPYRKLVVELLDGMSAYGQKEFS